MSLKFKNLYDLNDNDIKQMEPEINIIIKKSMYNNLLKIDPSSNYLKVLEKSIKEYEDANKQESVKNETEKHKPEESKKEDVIIKTSDEVKQDNKEEKKEEIINSPNESPIMETCGFTDKWSQENIKKFNDYMTTIKQNIDDKSNNQVSELARNDFNNLRLVGIKFSKNKKSNDMICVVANVNTCAVFEVFRVGNETEIHEFNNDEEYKKKVYERLDIASKKSDEEKTKYLNGYCRVDFKLLPTKKKSA